ncbi:MAG: PRC-barrel domain-containing protein [bacterium]|nr:PRC-barrel domain-containing protein [bacterium]
MHRLYSKIIGTPVYDDSVRPLTTVKDLIIDTETGKLLAFVVNQSKNLVIVPIDVVSWTEVIKINNIDSIIDGNDVIRISEVQKRGINLIHNKVETKNGEKLGKVNDFSVDTDILMLQKLYVSKGILGLVRYESRIISAKDIIEILPDKIVIKDNTKIKEKIKESPVLLEEMPAA